MNKQKTLITGNCGFIFSNFTHKYSLHLNGLTNHELVGVDKLVSQCNFKNMFNKLHIGDIADEHFMDMVFKLEKPEIVIHGAAESFVDDSIKQARPFVHSNVLGTQTVVDMCLKYNVEKMIMISTDECYGQLKPNEQSWTEESPINPRNPYSASKASSELVVKAAHETHGLPYIITRCCNNYGPRQPPRNLVPKVITCILNKQPIPIHGNGKQIREWIYVEDHNSAVMHLVENGKMNNIYNIGSGVELTNLEMVKKICNILGRGEDLLSFVKDRPGHDQRYSVDCSKIKKTGWDLEHTFDRGLEKTVQWYIDNPWYFQ